MNGKKISPILLTRGRREAQYLGKKKCADIQKRKMWGPQYDNNNKGKKRLCRKKERKDLKGGAVSREKKK